jgi:predicted transcriptional regulator of viral defense system
MKNITSGSSLKGLGPRERLLLTSLAAEGKRIFRTADAYSFWPSKQRVRKALSDLENKGWLQRLERGLYMIVPLEAGPGGRWTEDPLVIASQLVPDGAVGYWSALHYWNLTEQVPRTVFVQTVRQRNPSEIEILGVNYKFIRLVKNKIFGIVERMISGLPLYITDREKTLVDACDRPDLVGGIRQVAQVLRSGEALDWSRIDQYLERLDSGTIFKRLGFLVDTLDIQIPERAARLQAWQEKMSHGIGWLDIGGTREGPVRTKWRIRVNVPDWSANDR